VLATRGMGAGETVICACMRVSVFRSHICRRFGFGYGRLDHCSQRRYNRSNLDRNIEEVAANFGGVWLVEGRILRTLKPVWWVVHLVLGGLHEVRRSLGCDPTSWEVCQTVLATLLGAWGLGETVICACMRVSRLVARLADGLGLVWGVSTIAPNFSITGRTSR
jgi:hypothetical protein